MREDDEDLAKLLSGRTEPSVLAKEAVLERVLAHAAPSRARRLVPWLAPALAAAAALLFMLVPDRSQAPADDQFAARGASSAQPVLRARCVQTAALGRCASGGTLAFEASGTPEFDEVAVFARRQDGTVLWYLPHAAGSSASVPRDGSLRVLSEGAKLDASHPPGHYELIAVFSKEPLSRDVLKARLGDDLRGDSSLRVVRQSFVVEAAR